MGEIFGMMGWDPSVCKSSRLHVDILRFSFVELGYILRIPLEMIGNFPAVFYFNR